MPSLQSIKSRISGIAKTKQITRSMRQISFSKLQRSRAALETEQIYHDHACSAMDRLAATEAGRSHPFFAPAAGGKTGIVVIGTDRGLCGAYNMNMARRTARLVREKREVYIVALGGKSPPFLRREGIEVNTRYLGISEKPILEEAELLARQMLDLYRSGEIGEIYVVYTRFVSVLEQQADVRRLLPYEPRAAAGKTAPVWCFEPEEERLIAAAAPLYLSAAFYHAILESALCEQSARINSMDAAARNSDELLEKLTLAYNKLRQANITNEMIEIIGGAAAQK